MSKPSNKIPNLKALRALDVSELNDIAQELRTITIDTVSQTGGHLGAGLGVVELTVALHYVFETPKDLIVWDIGHQTYPHKILTDRYNKINTLRKPGGISGFTKRIESIYDCWGAGHCSTSISAAVGMAEAIRLKGENKKVIAIIGDGALSAGMAYEALNNASILKNNLIVILNDNEMSISPAVGGMSNYLSKLIYSKPLLKARNFLKSSLFFMPKSFKALAKMAIKNIKSITNNLSGNFFEEIGFIYVGPIDGHNIEDLVSILTSVKENINDKPVLIHIKTEKGKGFISNDSSEEKYHAVSKFDLTTKKQISPNITFPTYSKIFGNSLCREASKDEKIIAITAAMTSGTGLTEFKKQFPKRFYDVGIAEQHAVTFAAGLACEDFKPFVAIYSTFLQRAYDQVVHDVAIQNLPVRFIIDRAGHVGADGPTHAGSFDLAYLCALPNMVVMAPSNETELANMVTTAAKYNDGPIAIRFPRASAGHENYPDSSHILEIGKANIVNLGADIAILSLGTRLDSAVKAKKLLAKIGINITVADARFAKPIDTELVTQLCMTHQLIITIEEGSIGGFSSQVVDFVQKNNYDHKTTIRSLHFPDEFIEQNSYEEMNRLSGIEAEDIVKIVMQFRENKVKSSKSATMELV